MTHQIKSPELKEIQDIGLEIMRAARSRKAHLKYDALALAAANAIIKSRRGDLAERLNADKLQEIESKLIEGSADEGPKKRLPRR